MGAEVVFLAVISLALRYWLIRRWTTCLRVVRVVISIGWPDSCSGGRCSRDWCGRCSLSCRAYSARIRRRCRSPWISRWSRHWRRSVPAYRSARELARGDRAGALMIRAPLPVTTSSNAAVNVVSRSRIRKLNLPARSPRSMSRLRACWAARGPVGCAVTPRMCTRRVWISITKNTYRRLRNTVSACRKSHARIPAAWEVRNCRQAGDARRGAGVSPAAARIRRMVPAAMRYPRPASSPWLRRCPHRGFCLASCWTSARISAGTGGRPVVLG